VVLDCSNSKPWRLQWALKSLFGAKTLNLDHSLPAGKFGVLIFAAWGGADGGITAGLVSCSVLLVATSTAAHLMQDFRTGYLTLTSPRAMFVSQVVGALMGVVLAPATFQLFWRTGAVLHAPPCVRPALCPLRCVSVSAPLCVRSAPLCPLRPVSVPLRPVSCMLRPTCSAG
jgi:hypothetical protein